MPPKSQRQANALNARLTASGQAGTASVLPCARLNDPQLLVAVYCEVGARKTIHASVNAVGAKTTKPATGLADYSYVAVGSYPVTVSRILAPDDADYVIIAGAPQTVALDKGEKKTVTLLVDKKNIVTPVLELEYKVVLLDRKLSVHQPARPAAQLCADATYVEVSFSQTNPAHPYLGGARFSCTPANVEVYLDAQCTLPLVADVSAAQFAATPKVKLYLRGVSAGKFSAKLALIAPADAAIRIAPAVSARMGVVALEMRLFQYDSAAYAALRVRPDVAAPVYHDALNKLKLPPQVAMSDADRIGKGRLLHVENGQHFARAKLLVKKCKAIQWPDGCDDYEIVLTQGGGGGGVALHAKQWEHSVVGQVRIKLKDLQSKDQLFWVAGSAATLTPLQLDLGLDRHAGGLAKSVKRYADWASFNIVKINLVTVDYTAPALGASAWDAPQQRFYINLLADPAGRQITIAAQLSEKLAGIVLHFMLAPDENNAKAANWGVNLPATWTWSKLAPALKHADKIARDRYLHRSATTDANGYAKVELTLSCFGGDKFHPAVYSAQDPHLARYVRGHVDLALKQPVLRSAPVAVWRKVWYQVSQAAGMAPPAPANTVAAYQRIYTELVFDQTVAIPATIAPRTFYPAHMLELCSDDLTPVANIGDHNKEDIATLLIQDPAQPVKRHLMVTMHQCDPGPAATGMSAPITASVAAQDVDIIIGGDFVLDPPLKGGPMVTSLHWYRASDKLPQTLPAAAASIPRPRTAKGQIRVLLPLIVPPPTLADPVYVVAECPTAINYLGESFKVRQTIAVYDAAQALDYQDTVTHEFGHSFNQTPKPGAQRNPTAIPAHPRQFDAGQGNHCRVDSGTDAASGAIKYTCVMYDAGPMRWGTHQFCDKCQPYLLVQDFHQP